MQTRELLAKVRKIEIKTRKVVEELTGGAYRSVYKGRGIEFSEVRPYTIDDDVRDIDWNVTARTGVPHIKTYTEERELTVILAVDVSASTLFGTGADFKHDKIAETAALLAFSAIRNHDKVGLLLFSDKAEHYIPPRSDRSHVMRILRDLVAFKPTRTGTDINAVLTSLSHTLKKKSVIFLISDFMDDKDFSHSLRFLACKHDVAALRVMDSSETEFPITAPLELEDLESHSQIFFPGSKKAFLRYQEAQKKFTEHLLEIFRKSKVDCIDLNCSEEVIKPLMKFFHCRGKMKGKLA